VVRAICVTRDSFFWNEMELFRERAVTVIAFRRQRGYDGRRHGVCGDMTGDVPENFLPRHADL
jgi:hypothetical protein